MGRDKDVRSKAAAHQERLALNVASRQNARFKKARSLRRRKGREETGLWLVEGVRVLEEALTHSGDLQTLFVTPEAVTDVRTAQLLQRAEQCGASIVTVNESMLRELCDAQTPQGVVGVVRAPKLSLDLSLASVPWILVVDRIQDPGNLGTMLRTALAAGMDGAIVLHGTVDLGNPKVIRASAGAVFALPLLAAQPADLVDLSERGIALVTADLNGATDLYDIDWTQPTALLVGNEGNGPDPKLLAAADHVIRIPMPGPAESLNAAVAAAVCMYEGVRQRRRLSHDPR